MKKYEEVVSIAVLCFSAVLLFGQETVEPRNAGTAQWIKKLGDDSYFVRERAEEHLFRIGIGALPALRAASSGKDPEIAYRAEKIISRFNAQFTLRETKGLQIWIQEYAQAETITKKAGVIWILAHPSGDAPNGEGLPTLLRILRFDEKRELRAEAAKVLIAVPPVSPAPQKKWYRNIVRELEQNPNSSKEQDALTALVLDYAKIRCEWNERKNAAADKESAQRIEKLIAAMTAFQANPANNSIQPGNTSDILFYYAVAEMQEAAGLTAQRDKSVQAALAVRTRFLGKEHPLLPVNEKVNEPFYDHYDAGIILRRRYRLNWAKPHFQIVLENGPIQMNLFAAMELAEVEQFLCRYSEAAKYFEQGKNILSSEEYKDKYSDNNNVFGKRVHAGMYLCLAQAAQAADDWSKVRENVDKGLNSDSQEIDLLILSHKVIVHNPEIEPRYSDNLRDKTNNAMFGIERQMQLRAGTTAEERKEAAVEACNQAAWLLAGTGGSYSEAKALIDTAVKAEPENPAYLDTLAHVYFLGGETEKAIRTQENVVRLVPEVTLFREALERFRKMK
ncbi:MAG: hypothetical protein LBN39_04495 [Planctomycetaceae bacterium]|jgi:tetratricopeptide (TPR) repeat protein|nr:hypothetical protein [Planctomycetaceae bacterium]